MSSLVIYGDTSGSIALTANATAGTNTLTIADQTGTLNVAGPAFNVYNTISQSVSSGVWTAVTFGAELYDTNNCFTANKFTPTVAGYYQFNGSMRYSGTALGYVIVAFYKNGVAFSYGTAVASTTNQAGNTIVGSELIYCNGTTDYVQLYGYITGTSPVFDYANDTANCRFSGFLARGA